MTETAELAAQQSTAITAVAAQRNPPRPPRRRSRRDQTSAPRRGAPLGRDQTNALRRGALLEDTGARGGRARRREGAAPSRTGLGKPSQAKAAAPSGRDKAQKPLRTTPAKARSGSRRDQPYAASAREPGALRDTRSEAVGTNRMPRVPGSLELSGIPGAEARAAAAENPWPSRAIPTETKAPLGRAAPRRSAAIARTQHGDTRASYGGTARTETIKASAAPGGSRDARQPLAHRREGERGAGRVPGREPTRPPITPAATR
jgi:hypothetical protein